MDTRLIEAQILSSRARKWVSETRWARVLHVFERSCNLVNDRDEILSLVTSKLDAGPFAIVVSHNAAPFDQWVEPDAQIQVGTADLVLGDQPTYLRIAKEWDAYLPWEQLQAGFDMIVTRLQDVNSHLQLHAPVNSFSALANVGDLSKIVHRSLVGDMFSARILASALAPATWLCHGIVENNSSLINRGAAGLAGLGGGLTPSGDDYMMGAIYAAWLLYHPAGAGSIANQIVVPAAARTTLLSAAWLHAAQRGEAGMRWHLLFKALISADHAEISAAVHELTSVGHTSGADALAGFVGVLNLHKQLGSPRTAHPHINHPE